MKKKGDTENFQSEKANVLYFNVIKKPNQMSSYGQMILYSDESKVNDARENVEFIDTITNSECCNKSQGIGKSHNSVNYENDPLNIEDMKQEKEKNITIKEKKIEYKSNLIPNESKSALGRAIGQSKVKKGAEIPTLETIANTPNQETYAEKNLTEGILKNVERKSLNVNEISTENVSTTLMERNLANLKPLMLLANHTQQIILKINPILSKINRTDRNPIAKKSVHEKKKPKTKSLDKIATEISVSGAREIENIKQEKNLDDIITKDPNNQKLTEGDTIPTNSVTKKLGGVKRSPQKVAHDVRDNRKKSLKKRDIVTVKKDNKEFIYPKSSLMSVHDQKNQRNHKKKVLPKENVDFAENLEQIIKQEATEELNDESSTPKEVTRTKVSVDGSKKSRKLPKKSYDKTKASIPKATLMIPIIKLHRIDAAFVNKGQKKIKSCLISEKYSETTTKSEQEKKIESVHESVKPLKGGKKCENKVKPVNISIMKKQAAKLDEIYFRKSDDGVEQSNAKSLPNEATPEVHEEKKLHECEICDTTFSLQIQFNRHKDLLHSSATRFEEIKSFSCKICTTKFLSKCKLRNHIVKVHEKETSYKCNICESTFMRKQTLDKHVSVVHYGNESHKCEICGKTFTQQNNLEIHVAAVHEGEKPYKCNVCSVTFAQKAQLAKHRDEIHKEKRPFKCSICDDTFKRKEHMQKHILTVHEGKKTHKCTICDSSFARCRSLKNHIMVVHEG
jgi:stress-induced morphogen